MPLPPRLSPRSPACARQIKRFKPEAAAERGIDRNAGRAAAGERC